MRWAGAVACFGLCLKNSEYKGTSDETLILSLATSVNISEDEYRQQFVELVEKYFDNNNDIDDFDE